MESSLRIKMTSRNPGLYVDKEAVWLTCGAKCCLRVIAKGWRGHVLGSCRGWQRDGGHGHMQHRHLRVLQCLGEHGGNQHSRIAGKRLPMIDRNQLAEYHCQAIAWQKTVHQEG